MATPTPGMFGGVPGTPMYSIPTETEGMKQVYGGAEMPEGLPELKPEDQAVSAVLKQACLVLKQGCHDDAADCSSHTICSVVKRAYADCLPAAHRGVSTLLSRTSHRVHLNVLRSSQTSA